jgi:hypothetical protein
MKCSHLLMLAKLKFPTRWWTGWWTRQYWEGVRILTKLATVFWGVWQNSPPQVEVDDSKTVEEDEVDVDEEVEEEEEEDEDVCVSGGG